MMVTLDAETQRLPGTRLLMRKKWVRREHEERVLLWPLADDRWLALEPDDSMSDITLADFATLVAMNRRGSYPREVRHVTAFNRALDDAELEAKVVEARLEAETIVAAERLLAPAPPASMVNWVGAARAVPDAGRLRRVRHRLYGKQSAVRLESKPLAAAAEERGETTAILAAADAAAGAAPPGSSWLVSDVGAPESFPFGSRLTLLDGAMVRGKRALFLADDGGYYSADLVADAEVGSWSEKRLPAGAAGDGGGLEEQWPPPLGVGKGRGSGDVTPGRHVAAADEPEAELRTLWVDYDAQGLRYKSWREVTVESSEERFGDGPIEGPQSCLAICKHMERHGGNPKLWLAAWCKDLGASKRDRIYHELTTLIEVLWVAGTYDQLNVGGLMSLEVVARRILAIVDAHSKGLESPNWDNAKYYSGLSGLADIAPMELRHYVHRAAKEDHDVDSSRYRGRALGKGGGAFEAQAAGGLARPSDPAKKQTKKGDAKGKNKDKGDGGRGGGQEP
jgi:hypothetical protein